jgi:hypothetical protein
MLRYRGHFCQLELIMTAKLNDVDPQAWLTDVLSQIADIPQAGLPNYCRGIGSNRICERPPNP